MSRILGDLKERTLKFGEDILDILRAFPKEERAWIISRQLGRSASSVGANVWEADAALTDAEFARKISIVRQEASEVQYWIELSFRCRIISTETHKKMMGEAEELVRILSTIVRRTQEHIKRSNAK